MTVSPDPHPLPPPQPPPCDEVPSSHDEPRDERSTVTRLALAALVSWERTFRLLVLIGVLSVVLVGLVLLAMWLLPIDISLGPLQITRRGN